MMQHQKCKCITAAATYRCDNWNGHSCDLLPKTKIDSHQENLKRALAHLRQCEDASTKAYKKVRRMLRHTKLNVSDHALLRYLERVEKINTSAIRLKILTPQLLTYYQSMGDGEFPTGDGDTRAIIKGGIIVTIIN